METSEAIVSSRASVEAGSDLKKSKELVRKRLVMTEDVYFLTVKRANAMEQYQFVNPDTLLTLRYKTLYLAQLAFGADSLPAMSSNVAVVRALLLASRYDAAEHKLQAVHTECIEAIRQLESSYGEESNFDLDPNNKTNQHLKGSVSHIPPLVLRLNHDKNDSNEGSSKESARSDVSHQANPPSSAHWLKGDCPPDINVFGADSAVLWATRRQLETLLEEIIFLMATVCTMKVRDLTYAMTKTGSKQTSSNESQSNDMLEQAIAYAKAAQNRLKPLIDFHSARIHEFNDKLRSGLESRSDNEMEIAMLKAQLVRSQSILVASKRLQIWLHSHRGRPGHKPVIESYGKLLNVLNSGHIQQSQGEASSSIVLTEHVAHQQPYPILDVYILVARTYIALARDVEKKQMQGDTSNQGKARNPADESDDHTDYDVQIEAHLQNAYDCTDEAFSNLLASNYLESYCSSIKQLIPLQIQKSEAESSVYAFEKSLVDLVYSCVLKTNQAEDTLIDSGERPDIALIRVLAELCKLRAQALTRLASLKGRRKENEQSDVQTQRYDRDTNKNRGNTHLDILQVYNPVAGHSEPHSRVEALKALDCWAAMRRLLSLAIAGLSANSLTADRIFVNPLGLSDTTLSTDLESGSVNDVTLPKTNAILTAGSWDPCLPGATWTILGNSECSTVVSEAKQDTKICDVYLIEYLLSLGTAMKSSAVYVAECLTLIAEEDAGCPHSAAVATSLERLADVLSAVGEPEHARGAFIAALAIHHDLISPKPHTSGGIQPSTGDFHESAIQSIHEALKSLPGGDITNTDPYELASNQFEKHLDLNKLKKTKAMPPSTPKLTPKSAPKLTPKAKMAAALAKLAARTQEEPSEEKESALSKPLRKKGGKRNSVDNQNNPIEESRASEAKEVAPPSFEDLVNSNQYPTPNKDLYVVSPGFSSADLPAQNGNILFEPPTSDANDLSTMIEDEIVIDDSQSDTQPDHAVNAFMPPPPQMSSDSPRISVSSRKKSFREECESPNVEASFQSPEELLQGGNNDDDPFV